MFASRIGMIQYRTNVWECKGAQWQRASASYSGLTQAWRTRAGESCRSAAPSSRASHTVAYRRPRRSSSPCVFARSTSRSARCRSLQTHVRGNRNGCGSGRTSLRRSATGQARGAALVAARRGISAWGNSRLARSNLRWWARALPDKEQVQYMVSQLLSLDSVPSPDMPPMRWPPPFAIPPTKASADLRDKEQV